MIMRQKITASFTKGETLALCFVTLWILTGMMEPILCGGGPFSLTSYSYHTIDNHAILKPPGSAGFLGLHYLGSDNMGRDVLAGMIHGARVSSILALGAIFIGLITGGLAGLAVGYLGNQGLKKNVIQIGMWLLVFFGALYYGFFALTEGPKIYHILPLFILLGIGYFGDKMWRGRTKEIFIPLDSILMRILEVRQSISSLFIILAIAAVIQGMSFGYLTLIIGFLLWFTFARQFRVEAMKYRDQDFVLAAKAAGLNRWEILIFHILPNVMPSILVVAAFSMSGVILLEAALSYLGIGIPVEEVTWGKLLSSARIYPQAWWLALFPGLGIFIIIYSFNIIGDRISRKKQ